MKLLRIKKDAAGNLDDVKVQQADLAGRAAAADNAVDVSDTINGKTITSIFEADGITARKATSAGSAGNVASTINLKKITDIFESDGLKVKKASSATKLETARTVRTNLASTNAASFDGSSNITPGVSGTLPVANGGTGATSLDGANIVTKNTQQTITGQKKFNDYGLVLNDHADFVANDIDINSNPTSEKFAYFNGKDKNGNMLGAIGFYQDPAGNTGAYLQANRGATWGGNLGIKTKAGTSDVFAYAPNPRDNSNTNQIATTYWVNNKRPKINGNANYNSDSNFYAPITEGKSGNVLVSTGSGSPSWVTDFLGRNTSVYYASVTTGSKSFYQSIAKFTYIFFWLSGGTENYPFLIPRTEFIRKNSNNNKLSIASNDYNQNRYVNLYYVNEYGFYITSSSNIDMIEIVGMR